MSDKSFYKNKIFNPEKNLHWAGFHTTDGLYSLSKFNDLFAKREGSYGKISYFHRTLEYFSRYSQQELNEFQRQYLNLINHDQFACIYPAFMDEEEMLFLREEGSKFFQSAVLFTKDLASNSGTVPKFLTYLKAKNPQKIDLLNQVLSTSLYNYSFFNKNIDYAKISNQAPLYADCGIDFMYNGGDWILAELQFSYQSYPQNLHTLYKGLQKLFPELLENTTFSSYPDRRLKQLRKTIENIAEYKGQNIAEVKKIILDAWTATKHPTRNYKKLATQLDAEFYLFDEFITYRKSKNYKDIRRDTETLFMFNQPLLYFLDSDSFFEPILCERLEEYNNLCLTGLYEDYIKQRAFLANPPLIDILNDKAIYGLLPDMVEYYLEEKVDIPVSVPTPVWSLEDPLNPDQVVLTGLRKDKDRYVLCHRYLEAGDGIRVGKSLSVDEWNQFIETYVLEKPYLYVVRDLFFMDPDTTFRLYTCGNVGADGKFQSIETSDALLGRINPTGTLLEQSYFFLCASTIR